METTKITNIVDVSPEMASDIQWLWDSTNKTSEQIAAHVAYTHGSREDQIWISPRVVEDILGGAYRYEDHQD